MTRVLGGRLALRCRALHRDVGLVWWPGQGQPGGERLWALQVQQLHGTEQRLTPDEETQAEAAETEGVED